MSFSIPGRRNVYPKFEPINSTVSNIGGQKYGSNVSPFFYTKEVFNIIANEVSLSTLLWGWEKVTGQGGNQLEYAYRVFVNSVNEERELGFKIPPGEDDFTKKLNYGLYMLNFGKGELYNTIGKEIDVGSIKGNTRNILGVVPETLKGIKSLEKYKLNEALKDLDKNHPLYNALIYITQLLASDAIQRERNFKELLAEVGSSPEKFQELLEIEKRLLIWPDCIGKSKASNEQLVQLLIGIGVPANMTEGLNRIQLCDLALRYAGYTHEIVKSGIPPSNEKSKEYIMYILGLLLKGDQIKNLPSGYLGYTNWTGVPKPKTVKSDNYGVIASDFSIKNITNEKALEWLAASHIQKKKVVSFKKYLDNENIFDVMESTPLSEFYSTSSAPRYTKKDWQAKAAYYSGADKSGLYVYQNMTGQGAGEKYNYDASANA